MSEKKYYAVAKGYKTGIFSTWDECKEQVNGYSGAIYKSFGSEKEAKSFIDNQNKVLKRNKTCILCARPLASSGELCMSCRRKKNAFERKLTENSNGREEHISNCNLVFLKEKYPSLDVFEMVEKDPKKFREAIGVSKITKRKIKNDRKQYFRENTKIENTEKIPDFVYSLLGSTKEVLKVSGARNNPNIIYKCKLCGETLYTKYSEYLCHSGHDCSSIKSSGELIVEEFLKKQGVKYRTQRNTLKCINPDTNSVMPYDFELTGRKVLIEVQGEQHKKFIPRFHVTIDGFEYQRKKDIYKKEFAQKNGYKLIEIWYEDLTEEKLSCLLGDYIK